jgi:hypothetical protein
MSPYIQPEARTPSPGLATFPPWIRWSCAAWLLLWIPAYWRTWGPANFLHLCDLAVILTCVGLWRGSALLLSSQAVSSLVGDSLWIVDAAWNLLAGKHLFGGTEYLWDAHFPAWVRALSLFHLLLPLLLLCCLRKVGYDRRGFFLQSAIAAALLVASRFTDPAKNINFAFVDPLFHHAWNPAPLHLAIIFAGFVVLAYLPAHFLLLRFFCTPAPAPTPASPRP